MSSFLSSCVDLAVRKDYSILPQRSWKRNYSLVCVFCRNLISSYALDSGTRLNFFYWTTGFLSFGLRKSLESSLPLMSILNLHLQLLDASSHSLKNYKRHLATTREMLQALGPKRTQRILEISLDSDLVNQRYTCFLIGICVDLLRIQDQSNISAVSVRF